MAKTILITGASSGLGAGMAHEFAAKGYNLAICARRLDRLETLKNELENQYGIKVIAKSLDVTNYDQVFEVFRAFKQEFGYLDRIIVNAGVGNGRRIGKGNFEINRATAETNFISALAQCEAAIEIFRAQNAGHLVVMSSMSAMRGLPNIYRPMRQVKLRSLTWPRVFVLNYLIPQLKSQPFSQVTSELK